MKNKGLPRKMFSVYSQRFCRVAIVADSVIADAPWTPKP